MAHAVCLITKYSRFNLKTVRAGLRLRYFGAMELAFLAGFFYVCGRLRINFRKNKSGLIQTFE